MVNKDERRGEVGSPTDPSLGLWITKQIVELMGGKIYKRYRFYEREL